VEALKNLTPSTSPCKGEGNKKKLWLPFSLQGEGVGGCGAFSFHVTSVLSMLLWNQNKEAKEAKVDSLTRLP